MFNYTSALLLDNLYFNFKFGVGISKQQYARRERESELEWKIKESVCGSKTVLNYFALITGPRINLDVDQVLCFGGFGEKQTERKFLA